MPEITLYCVARTDMESMTPGRVAAQISHASTKAMFEILKEDKTTEIYKMFDTWINEADGFGTTIVLQPNSNEQEKEFDFLLKSTENNELIHAGKVIDPEYFIKDGKTFHIVENVTTCVYFFGKTQEIKNILGSHKLF